MSPDGWIAFLCGALVGAVLVAAIATIFSHFARERDAKEAAKAREIERLHTKLHELQMGVDRICRRTAP